MSGTFFLGVCVGGAGSFFVLREITERRLVTWKRPYEGLTDSFLYHRRLRRLVLDELVPLEDDFSEKMRRVNNSIVRSLAGRQADDDDLVREVKRLVGWEKK